MICLALIPLAVLSVLGLVQHHPQGDLDLDQHLAVLGQPGLAAGGVAKGGDGSNLAHHRLELGSSGVSW